MSQISLPHYKKGTKEYSRIHTKLYRFRHKKEIKKRSINWRVASTQLIKETQSKYYKNNKEIFRKSALKLRLKAFQLINNKIECSRCGCSDIRFLEINHKNGGGYKELRKNNKSNIAALILYKKRRCDDLEILCRPCNAIHALELRFGKEIPLVTHFINNDWEKEL